MYCGSFHRPIALAQHHWLWPFRNQIQASQTDIRCFNYDCYGNGFDCVSYDLWRRLEDQMYARIHHPPCALCAVFGQTKKARGNS